MKLYNAKNFYSGLMFIAIGVGFAWVAVDYSIGTAARMGPGYFPMLLGILMTLLGIGITVEGFKADSLEGDDDGKVSKIDFRSLGLVSLAIAVFGFALPKLGFEVALAGLIGIGALASHEFKAKDTILLFLVLTATALVVFVWGLELQLKVLTPFFQRG